MSKLKQEEVALWVISKTIEDISVYAKGYRRELFSTSCECTEIDFRRGYIAAWDSLARIFGERQDRFNQDDHEDSFKKIKARADKLIINVVSDDEWKAYGNNYNLETGQCTEKKE